MDETTYFGIGSLVLLIFWGFIWGPDALNADHSYTDALGRPREAKIGFWSLILIVLVAWLYAEIVMKDGALFKQLKNVEWKW